MIYNQRIILFIVVTAFCIYSCNSPDSYDGFVNPVEIEALPFDETLRGKVISLDKERTEMLHPLRIINLNDEYLIVSDYKPNDIFLVFTIPELKFLYGWGRKGSGPDEFPVTRIREINQRENEIILFEPLSQKLRIYAVEDTEFVRIEEQWLQHEGQLGDPLYNIRRLKDSLYVADYGTSFEDTKFEHIALRPGYKKELFFFGEYPEVDIHNVLRYEEFLKLNASHPSGKKFAVFYIYYNWIKIYNSKGELLENVKYDDAYVDHNKSVRDFFQYRTQLWATVNYIYSLGLNVTREKFNEDLESVITSLEVWDWEGRPLFRAKFDKPVHGFTISERYGKLYAYSLLNTNEIYEYDLSEILNQIKK